MKFPKIKLISCTSDPVETVLSVWIRSRPTSYKKFLQWNNGRLPTATDIKKGLQFSRENPGVDIGLCDDSVYGVFKKVIAMNIPVSECIHFTWGFENLPVSWREQAVRKRQWGFWLTSMREFPVDKLYSSGQVSVPERFQDSYVNNLDNDAALVLKNVFKFIEVAYTVLLDKGMTPEEARCILPLATKHNGSMFSTFRTLLDTLSSRSCWISQLELWGPVLKGMVEELSVIHPLMSAIISPPCFDRYSNIYNSCKFKLINENRCSGKDKYMPCPLYCTNEHSLKSYDKVCQSIISEDSSRVTYKELADRHLDQWECIWNRNPVNGELKYV